MMERTARVIMSLEIFLYLVLLGVLISLLLWLNRVLYSVREELSDNVVCITDTGFIETTITKETSTLYGTEDGYFRKSNCDRLEYSTGNVLSGKP